MSEQGELKRAVGPVQLMLYGIGSMLGAGIYGLVGKAAGVMGSAIWIAFLVSMIAALLTGISYASIASRYPRAAGAAYAAHRAYGSSLVSYVVGLTVVFSGLSSIATQSKVVAVNLLEIMPLALPVSVVAVAFLLVVAGVVFRGIRESLWFNAVCTAVEASGLLFVIAIGARYWGSANLLELPSAASGVDAATGLLVMQGAVLTFFSFIGFEDMINVAEEVKNPRRNMPLAVLGAMIIVSLIYMAISVTAVSVVPWRELEAAPGPLTEVVRRAAPWFPHIGFTFITIFAVANTALVNYVMGSRLLYGMARQGLAPSALGRVHARRQTPHVAILVLLLVVIGLSFLGDISQLAAATVILLLVVFTLLNIALVVLKLREGNIPGAFNAPIFVPVLGAVICAALIVARVTQSDDWRAPAIAGGLIGAIVVAYVLTGKGRAERVAAYWAEERAD
jgi:amino acid transporter